MVRGTYCPSRACFSHDHRSSEPMMPRLSVSVPSLCTLGYLLDVLVSALPRRCSAWVISVEMPCTSEKPPAGDVSSTPPFRFTRKLKFAYGYGRGMVRSSG